MKYIQHTTKGNLLPLKDFLERWKARFLSTWQLFQKNIYFDVLDDIVNKYNNIVHRTIKMKPIDITYDSYAEYNGDSNVTKLRLNSKLVIMLAFQNTKSFLLKEFYVKLKDAIIQLIVGLTKKTLNEVPSYKNESILS